MSDHAADSEERMKTERERAIQRIRIHMSTEPCPECDGRGFVGAPISASAAQSSCVVVPGDDRCDECCGSGRVPRKETALQHPMLGWSVRRKIMALRAALLVRVTIEAKVTTDRFKRAISKIGETVEGKS